MTPFVATGSHFSDALDMTCRVGIQCLRSIDRPALGIRDRASPVGAGFEHLVFSIVAPLDEELLILCRRNATCCIVESADISSFAPQR